MTVFGALAAFLGVLYLSPIATAQSVGLGEIPIQSLTVRVDETDSEFNVIDSRMDETATAAVFFGMVGAVINSADNNAEDSEKAEPLRPTAGNIDLDGLILRAVNERLASRNSVALAPAPGEASHTLLIEIGDWGLIRRAQRPDTSMRAFLKLNISLLDARGRRVWGQQREHSVSQMVAELSAFTPDIFQAEMESLAVRAGYQVANRVIYR